MNSQKHFFSYILFLLLNLLLLISCQESRFRFNLGPLIEECFSEYFPDKTLVIYEIISGEGKCHYVLTNPKKAIVEDKTSIDFSYPFTTYEGGVYDICITNTENRPIEIEFSLKYGVGAKDYSSIARAKDLKPVDLALEKLSDRAKDMSHRISFSQSHENIFENFLDSISSKVMTFSSIVIIIMILVGYMETLYLKNFMRRRKII
jgi:hypothetical protein